MMRCSREDRTSNFRVLDWPRIRPSSEGLIFWHIANFTEDMPQEQTIDQFRKVFDAWQVAFDRVPPAGRYITLTSTPDYDRADIILYFVDKGKRKQIIDCADGHRRIIKIPQPMDGPGNVLAYVPYGEHNGYFDNSEKWSDLSSMKDGIICLYDVALHELGHTFDLGHSSVPGAVMEPYYDGKSRDLSEDDQKGLNAVWSKPKLEMYQSVQKLMVKNTAPHTLLIEMLKWYGVKEKPGPESNPDLLTVMKKYVSTVEDDSRLAWCSILMDHICQENGIEHPDSPAAVDWKKVGKPVNPEDIRLGDVVVFFRDKEANWQGHVALFISHSEHQGKIWVLGANQSNMVNISEYRMDKIRKDGIRRLSFIENT